MRINPEGLCIRGSGLILVKLDRGHHGALIQPLKLGISHEVNHEVNVWEARPYQRFAADFSTPAPPWFCRVISKEGPAPDLKGGGSQRCLGLIGSRPVVAPLWQPGGGPVADCLAVFL